VYLNGLLRIRTLAVSVFSIVLCLTTDHLGIKPNSFNVPERRRPDRMSIMDDIRMGVDLGELPPGATGNDYS